MTWKKFYDQWVAEMEGLQPFHTRDDYSAAKRLVNEKLDAGNRCDEFNVYKAKVGHYARLRGWPSLPTRKQLLAQGNMPLFSENSPNNAALVNALVELLKSSGADLSALNVDAPPATPPLPEWSKWFSVHADTGRFRVVIGDNELASAFADMHKHSKTRHIARFNSKRLAEDFAEKLYILMVAWGKVGGDSAAKKSAD
ncbi:MAG: hypothetical protein KDD89_05815 [Anaerolineales bacterium]|nr:hypothetical protein [Anaerolineales bacterium]